MTPQEALACIVAIRAAIAALPQRTRVPLDDDEAHHVVLVTRELVLDADTVALVKIGEPQFDDICRGMASFYDCALSHGADGSLTFRKMSHQQARVGLN